MTPRTALVTGATRGIGWEICRRLARREHRIVLTARDRAAGEAAAAALKADGSAVRFEILDVASRVSVRACAERLAAARLEPDVLVNNAGIFSSGGVLDGPSEDFEACLRTNALGALWTCRCFVPGMIRRGWGRVVNLSTGYAAFTRGPGGPAAYALSKTWLNGLTRMLAREVEAEAGSTVKVNAADPGWVRTRMGGDQAPLSVEEGADTPVWLATLPDDGPSGGFFRGRRRVDW